MSKKSVRIIIIALCTSVALIVFSFYQSRGASIPLSSVAFFIAAAAICVSTAASLLLTCKVQRPSGARPHGDIH
jgi:hypothetical protein